MQSAKLSVLEKCTTAATPCGWPEFIQLINELIKFAIYIAILAAGINIALAGFRILMSGDNAGARSKAIGSMWNSVWGIIITMIAWIVVQFILTNLGLKDGYSLLA